MKSVYVGRKASDNSIAVAFDILIVGDPKTLGALLKLTAEAGLIVDRVDREEVVFEEPVRTNYLKDPEDKRQMEIDFSRSGGDRGSGPADMPVGFKCEKSGPCPNERKSCTNCEFAKSSFQKVEAVTRAVAEVLAEPEVTPEGEPTLVDEINASPMMQWANPDAGEPAGEPEDLDVDAEPDEEDEVDPVEETEAAIAGGILDEEGNPIEGDEDDSEFGQDEPRSDDADENGDWENAGEATENEGAEAQEVELPY